MSLLFIWRLARNRDVIRNHGMLVGHTAIAVGVTSTLSIVLAVVTLFGLQPGMSGGSFLSASAVASLRKSIRSR